jgi:hypothetical protein
VKELQIQDKKLCLLVQGIQDFLQKKRKALWLFVGGSKTKPIEIKNQSTVLILNKTNGFPHPILFIVNIMGTMARSLAMRTSKVRRPISELISLLFSKIFPASASFCESKRD